ncbi:MAG: DUF2093 domain-containing protein [Beijerinckiaceae bacterium]
MNKMEKAFVAGTEAELRYHHGEYKIIRHGTFVRCAVTGAPIALEDLKYWNVETQEAYATTNAVLKRLRETKAPSVTF